MNDIKSIKEEFSDLKENVILRDYTTMGVGGVADYFYIAKDILSLSKIVSAAIDNHIPYFVLGGGSNILVSDSGFPGIVIKNETNNIVKVPEASQLIVDSGITNSRLVSETAQQGLTGLEFLTGIPGTVGGAVYGNAGASGMSIGNYVKEITILHPPKSKLSETHIIRHKSDWMEYEYRSSKLKREYSKTAHEINKPVLLTIKFGLAPAKKDDILRRIQEFNNQRIHLPKGKSCGCIFKNPERNKERSAGAYIDRAKLKKKKVGEAFISPIHANYIINRDRARASDVRQLIEEVRFTVNDKFNINLEEEVEYIGRW